MTNKEAIKELRNIARFNYTLAPPEVFTMAIEALKAQRPHGEWIPFEWDDHYTTKIPLPKGSDSPMEEYWAEEFKNEPKETTPPEQKTESADTDLIVLPEGAMENPRKALVDYCKDNGIDINEVARIHKLNNKSNPGQFLEALSELVSIYG